MLSFCTLFVLGCSQSSTKTTTAPTTTAKTIKQPSTSTEEKEKNPKRENQVEATLGAQVFQLEVSRTPAERELGLMYRESMQYNQGMLFVFDSPGRHRFWMKNTLIPLDILWLNQAKEIIHFETAQPCYKEPCDIVGPDQNSWYVVELPAGSFVEEIGSVVAF